VDSILERLEKSDERHPPRQKRRLSDVVLIAFHHACDQSDIEVASELLHVLDLMVMRRPNFPTGRERRVQERLVAAHERLGQIQHDAPSTVTIERFDSVWLSSNRRKEDHSRGSLCRRQAEEKRFPICCLGPRSILETRAASRPVVASAARWGQPVDRQGT
jgi:hypothetical protein